ncbi:hsc70 cochaperone [Diplocarpon rosae]|nr:hsc70 cochaperone [Diplocarpon rosae]
MATTKQRLALSIIDFLNTSLSDGTLTDEDRESVEVAQSCIAESFKVDPTDATPKDSQTLLQIYSVYEKLKSKAPAAAPTTSPAPSSKQPTDAQKKEAESLKSEGNAAMAKKDYAKAIDLYGQALALIPETGDDSEGEVAERAAPAGGSGGKPDLSALAGMFGGGGAGGAGGMPDLSSIMSNPMFASMAQNLMSNPGMMENLMSNPRIRDMASQFGGGAGAAPADGAGAGAGAGGRGTGGMPDLASLMQDPSIAEM